MRFPSTAHPETIPMPSTCENRRSLALSPSRDHHSSLQCRTVRQSSRSPSLTDQTYPPEEYIYTETVKSIGNNEFIEEKRLLKRASWGPTIPHERGGLPPSGKRLEIEPSSTSRNCNRVRLRPKTARYYQSQEGSTTHARPVSYTERYNRRIFDYQQQQQQQTSLVS